MKERLCMMCSSVLGRHPAAIKALPWRHPFQRTITVIRFE